MPDGTSRRKRNRQGKLEYKSGDDVEAGETGDLLGKAEEERAAVYVREARGGREQAEAQQSRSNGKVWRKVLQRRREMGRTKRRRRLKRGGVTM